MFIVFFFVPREIMFHVSTLLPFSNGDSQQVIMDVTGPSLRNGARDLPRYYKHDPPGYFHASQWLRKSKEHFHLSFPPPPPKVAKATIQQNFQISVGEMLTEKQI